VRVRPTSSASGNHAHSYDRDGTSHLDPVHERRLLVLSKQGRNVDSDSAATHAFIRGRTTREELGEELGEAFLASATPGEPSEPGRLNRITDDEEGGPLITTAAEDEFADGGDESNIEDATREPFPRTSSAGS